MPTDPNAGLIKANQDLARVLAENTKATNELTKEIKARFRKTVTVTNHGYLDRSPEDGTDKSGPSGTDSSR